MFSRVQPTANSNSRKRQKRHHSSDNSDAGSPPTDMPSATSLAPGGGEHSCHYEQALKRLEPDLDSMRGLITCKVCQRFLSEPYGLACGHTYCYVCLDAWLVMQKKRTCPDCRAVIRQQPVPSFLIREMTRVFAYRAELLPDGETVEEHDEYIKEAVAKVAQDKEGRGLFNGMFKHGERTQWQPLHDPGDDVERCPNCHWELEEDGVCNSCGLQVGDGDGFGYDEVDDDEDLSDQGIPGDGSGDFEGLDEDDYWEEAHREWSPDPDSPHPRPRIDINIFGAMPIPAPALRQSRNHPRRLSVDSESDSEDSEDPDNDPEMDGFLVDDDEGEPEGSDSESGDEQDDSEEEAEETPRHRRRMPARPITIDSDDDDEPPRPARRDVVALPESDTDEDAPDATTFQRELQRRPKPNRRPPQIVELSSSDDEESSGDGQDNDNNDNSNASIHEFSSPDSSNGGVAAANGSASPPSGHEGTYGAYESYYPGDSDGDDDGPGHAIFDADYHNTYGVGDGEDAWDPYGGADDDARSMTAGSAPSDRSPVSSGCSC